MDLKMLKQQKMEINLIDINITPDLDSIERIPMSDEEYFGPKYACFDLQHLPNPQSFSVMVALYSYI